MTKRIAGFLLVLLLLAASAPAAAWGVAASPAASLPSVTIGSIGQPIGNITITENAAGALSSTVTYSTPSSQVAEPVTTSSPAILRLLLPPGVTFTSTPAVSVTSGDLQIGEVASNQLPGDQGYLDIRIVRSSTVPSAIEVSGIELTLDRTVPEGQIILRILRNCSRPDPAAAGRTASQSGTGELALSKRRGCRRPSGGCLHHSRGCRGGAGPCEHSF